MQSCSFIHSNYFYLVVLYYLYILINFLKLYHNILHSSITKVMAFGTPSAQVRDPVETSSPPPPTSAHTILRGKNYPAAEELSGCGIIVKERKRKGTVGVREVRAGSGGPKIQKSSHSAENCRTVLKIPYSIAE